MVKSRVKEQLDAAVREMESWPDWKKEELKKEIEKTPLKIKDRIGS